MSQNVFRTVRKEGGGEKGRKEREKRRKREEFD
jgi:hypothetical protein